MIKPSMIVIVDYGMGNLKSVQNAVSVLGHAACISDSAALVAKADKIIFPGVGHFGRAMRELKKRNLITILKSKIGEGVPFLGICLGMQILFDESQEAPGLKGFGIISGKVRRFSSKKLIIPHMGWNQIKIQDAKRQTQNDKLLKGIKDGSYFYFVHSYYCQPKDKGIILTTTHYGIDFASSIHKDNVWAVQFHAEKSQQAGLALFNNFLKYC